MKKFLKLLTVFILTVLTVFATACKPATNSSSSDSGNAENGTEISADRVKYQGTHIMTAPDVETEDYIVKNSQFQYTLVIKETTTTHEKTAKTEFELLLKRALGVTGVNTVIDSSLTEYSDDTKYISLGDTKYFEMSGLTYDKEALKANGARIITKGKNIFLLGGYGSGLVNAVYDFFNICFDYEYYSRNIMKIDTNVTNLKLKQFDVTDIPDIDYLNVAYGPFKGSTTTATSYDFDSMASEYMTTADITQEVGNRYYRMRQFANTNSLFMIVSGKDHNGKAGDAIHNSLNVFSPHEEGFENNWIAESRNQICWTAHGDTDSLERMKEFCVQKIIDHLIKYPVAKSPDMNRFMIGNEDGGTHCSCAACKASMDETGSFAGASVKFANDVVERVYQWMNADENGDGEYDNADYRRENFKIVLFAYTVASMAPVASYNESTDAWIASPGCELNENVIIYNTGPLYLYRDFYDEANADKFLYFKQWSDISNGGMYAWLHGEFYHNAGHYMDPLSGMSPDLMQLLASYGTELVFIELYSGGDTPTGWSDLHMYVLSKIAWDSTLNVGDLIDEYLNAAYGIAAETMKNLYYQQRTYFQYAQKQYAMDNNDTPFVIGVNSFDPKYYPYSVLKGYLAQTDKALQEIKVYEESNPALYRAIKDRIETTSAQYYYMIHDLYAGIPIPPYTVEEKLKYKEAWCSILEKHSIHAHSIETAREW